MAIVGKGAKSIKKKDLANQKSIGIGFKKLRFWHKADAGETGINLLNLIFPTELQPTGRQNPSAFELTSANIKFFKNNLTIRSSLRGVLMDGLAYDVASSTRINWVGFTAAQDEIFEVTLDENAKTGRNIVDGRQIIASGILPAGETDINIGSAFEINKNPTANVGAVTLHIDRALQLRNTNNSDTTKDKDYWEVDPGGGLGIILRLNSPDLSNDREYVVMSLGVVAEKPNESQLQEIERVQGQIDAMVPTLAALAGVSETDFQSAGPNNIDLKAFGNQVITNKNDIASLEDQLDDEPPVFSKISDFKNGAGDNVWLNVPNNGLTINEPGIYAVTGYVIHNRSAGSGLVTRIRTFWGAANGDDTGVGPADIGTLAGVDSLSGEQEAFHNNFNVDQDLSDINEPVRGRLIRVTSPVTLYLVPLINHGGGTWNVKVTLEAVRMDKYRG